MSTKDSPSTPIGSDRTQLENDEALVTHDAETADSTEVFTRYEDQPLTVGWIESVVRDYEKRIGRLRDTCEDGDYWRGKADAYRDALKINASAGTCECESNSFGGY